METYIIGDVHGCYDELLILLNKIYDLHKPDDPVRLVFLGDLIDKGPSSIDVVELFHNLHSSCGDHFGYGETVCLMGNHEDKFLRWIGHEERSIAFNRAYQNPIFRKEDWNIPLVRWGHENKDLLLSMPIWYKIPDTDIICVHGGIAPMHGHLPPSNWSEATRRQKSLLFTRFVNPRGEPVTLGLETKDDVFWADSYDGRFGYAIYGHQPFSEVKETPHALGIDTGCVFGGFLTALRASDKKLIQVRALDSYAAHHKQKVVKGFECLMQH